jgi:precorrin-6Y C5,15-methyltransferase (decarboxylating)
LSIVGIGEDGVDGLSAQARELVRSATVVFGGTRHLALASPLIRGDARPWTRPFEQSIAEVLAHRNRAVCVLASGDPFFHGVGSLLSQHVSRAETLAVPAPSAFSLAASRLLWPLPQTVLLSLCGQSIDLVRPHLHPGARILALTSDQDAPGQMARLLCKIGFKDSLLTVLESLGGPREQIRTRRADCFDLMAPAPLSTVAIEVVAAHDARILSRAAGLPDHLFEHDGQITQREIRALTLSALAPRRGERLWDIGAGCGSVAIEWMLADTSLSAFAIEHRSDRIARAKRNAAAFGVPQLQWVEGSAPAALEALPTPDAVFIGGGVTIPGMLDTVQSALRTSGRLVANAASLESETVLLQAQSRWGGSMLRAAISRGGPLGGEHAGMSGWHPAMPITQWTWVKP